MPDIPFWYTVHMIIDNKTTVQVYKQLVIVFFQIPVFLANKKGHSSWEVGLLY